MHPSDVTIEAIDGGARRVSVVISTERPNLNDHIIRSRGCIFSDFLRYGSGPVLWEHDRTQIIARAISVDVAEARITSVAEFPPAGMSLKSDEVYYLIHTKAINSVSIGYKPLQKSAAGNKPSHDIVDSWRLLEFSFVKSPANIDASIISRGQPSDLKIKPSDLKALKYKNPDLYMRWRLADLQNQAMIQDMNDQDWLQYASRLSQSRHGEPL